MADTRAVDQNDDDFGVADWISEVMDEDRIDSSRSIAPPVFKARPESLLNRVVEAERR